MNEEKANDLAARIREQFPHVSTVVVQSENMRNAPNNWIIGVQRRESFVEGISIHIHNELEWLEATQTLFVLQPPFKQYEPPSYDAIHTVEAYRREYEKQAQEKTPGAYPGAPTRVEPGWLGDG